MNSGCFASNQYVKPHITQESLPARSIRTWVSLHVALPVAVHFDAIPLLMLFATGHPWACWSGMVLALVKYRIAYILSLHTSEQKLAAYRTCAGSNKTKRTSGQCSHVVWYPSEGSQIHVLHCVTSRSWFSVNPPVYFTTTKTKSYMAWGN